MVDRADNNDLTGKLNDQINNIARYIALGLDERERQDLLDNDRSASAFTRHDRQYD
jgi:hypothetical protein